MAYGGSGPHYYGLTGKYPRPKEDFNPKKDDDIGFCGFPILIIVSILLILVL